MVSLTGPLPIERKAHNAGTIDRMYPRLPFFSSIFVAKPQRTPDIKQRMITPYESCIKGPTNRAPKFSIPKLKASSEINVTAPHAKGITPESPKISAPVGILEITKSPLVCVAP